MNIWDSVYSSDDSFFGEGPSILAKESLHFLDESRCKSILELGCGQGRDAVFFARNGFNVHATDFSSVSVSQLRENIARLGLEENIRVSQVDLSKELPEISREERIDTVYSNAFYCMPFTDEELNRLLDFVYGLIPEGGLHIFSFRDKKRDQLFLNGKKISWDTCETNGVRVRFFTEDEMLRFIQERFRVLQTKEAYEEPSSLILAITARN